MRRTYQELTEEERRLINEQDIPWPEVVGQETLTDDEIENAHKTLLELIQNFPQNKE